MKLLLDENLSPRLAALLSGIYPGSVHISQVGLESAADLLIWDYAKRYGFTIVSKDSDFYNRSVLLGCPPKVIWLRAGNCPTKDIESLLRGQALRVQAFVETSAAPCLIVTRKAPR